METLRLIDRGPIAVFQPATRYGHPSRFTLIELLVVIAVIAMLAALLMPALAKSRYRAKNVLCIGNQKQLAAGISMYTSDYDDRYPTTSTPDHNSAADLAIRNGYNYVENLRSYFGGNMKGTWTCTVAPPNFQKGGGTRYGGLRDLDVPTTGDTLTTYSHFYGRVKGLPGDNMYKTAWGTGTFGPETPMLKTGNPFLAKYASSTIESNVLLTDTIWRWNIDTFVYTHQPYSGPKPPDRGFVSDQYSRIKIGLHGDSEYDDMALYFMNNDMNYTLDDGSVHHLPTVRHLDARVMYIYGYVLPRPE